jgi:glyoxylate/hydroxypyruvate reductase A
MALLLKTDIDREDDAWQRALRALEPDMTVHDWPYHGDPAEIEFALVWAPPRGALRKFPNLKAIFSIGAGIDHLASDPELPDGVPVVRMVEPGLTTGMTEFVILSVLTHHRFMLDYAAQQRDKVWREIPQIAAGNRTVGIMGLGVLGGDAGDKLAGLGFDVAGWSRSPKKRPGITTFHGTAGLAPFLARSEILICLLPLTPETKDILNARTFAALPRGAALISIGRGNQVVEADLLAALDSGQIGGATLDVFRTEPLPPESPFWAHPRVILTPHVASMTIPDTAAEAVTANIRRLRAGKPLKDVVDLRRGY